jgi:phosphodiesterase/alkaline phosphatase D-like protein
MADDRPEPTQPVSPDRVSPNDTNNPGVSPSRPLGPRHVSERTARAAHAAARVTGEASVALFLAWRVREGIPANGDLGHWEVLLQLVLLGGVVLGIWIARKWEMVGATLMAIFGVAIALVLSNEHEPVLTIPVATMFMLSPFLHWIAWQRDQPTRSVVALGIFLLTTLLTAGWWSVQLFDQFYGPAHPTSDLQALPDSEIEWIWSGAVTPTSAVVHAGVDSPAGTRLVVATDTDFTRRVAAVEGTDAALDAGVGAGGSVARYGVEGLEPDTTYHYAVEVDGKLDDVRAGVLHTFPTGPDSFTLAVGHCARTGSNGAVFDTIRAHNPLLYVQLGDLHYADIADNDLDAFAAAYEAVLTSPSQSALYRSAPLAYVWDDHDSGPNDADSTSDARPAAQLSYRTHVPHYPLAAGPGETPIYQAFSVGRVRVIMMDTRSARSPKDQVDGPAKTMLGDTQQAWLEEELLAADDEYPLIVLVSSVPWIHTDSPGNDDWAGYTTERAEIADFIADHDIDGLLMVGGDAHMVAIDDGSHSDFSASGDARFPVFHAGALDNAGSEKGGPYSEGTWPGPGHFGLIEVADDGGNEIGVTLRGMTWEDEELVSYSFTVPADPAEPPPG